MRTQKMKIAAASLFGSFLLGACGMIGQVEAQTKGAATPEETVQCTMESLKELDLETFNECTDNHVETYYNWLGIPVEREYRVFNELLQPGLKRGKHYRFNLAMAEKTVEHLEWEITDIRENGDQAEIDMEITNLDMADVTGNYVILVWENMVAAEGTGMWQMISDMADLANGGEALLALMDELEDTCTIAVTVSAWREDGCWKLHASDEFINAFMGNMNLGDYSEEVEARIAELEEAYEEKIEAWGTGFENKVEKWANGIFE
ncbi:MAG: hypothetical protein K2H40_11205 [Lachnospiraceae bacterium]|nr:hypothetical protein [Lachnospiraceae bacterium]